LAVKGLTPPSHQPAIMSFLDRISDGSEGRGVERKWVIDAEIMRPGALPVTNQC